MNIMTTIGNFLIYSARSPENNPNINININMILKMACCSCGKLTLRAGISDSFMFNFNMFFQIICVSCTIITAYCILSSTTLHSRSLPFNTN